MKGYVLNTYDKIHDMDLFLKYKELAGKAIKKYKGRTVRRAEHTQVIRGNWNPERIILIEFDSPEIALDFCTSKEYTEANQISAKCTTNCIHIVITPADGV
jgi:uncharacterized protein (DUF1330 family)